MRGFSAVLSFVLLGVAFSHLHPCNTQADCNSAFGMRCQYKAGKGFRLACEIKPDGVNKQCQCRVGCLMCDGGVHTGASRFIEPFEGVKVGCGLNWRVCINPIYNSIIQTLVKCTDSVWNSHCSTGGGGPIFTDWLVHPRNNTG